MSGFVAIIGDNNPNDCKKMLAAIRHRGPDILDVDEISPAVFGQDYSPADRFWAIPTPTGPPP